MANIKILEDVAASYSNAYGAFQIWITFINFGPPLCKKYKIKPYSQFFIASARAFATSTIIEIYTLFDKRKDVSSLKNLIESAKPNIGNDEYKKLVVRRNLMENNAGKIKILRNKVIGHKSTDSSMGSLLEDLQ